MKEELNFKDENNISPEKYLEEMRNRGQIEDSAYQELIYRFEDIDDEFIINDFEKYKKAYKNNRLGRCAELLIKLAKSEDKRFRKGFLLSDALKNPMGNKYTENEYKKTMCILVRAMEEAKKQKLSDAFITDLKEMFLYTYIFYNINKANTERLGKNNFSAQSLSRQLRIICIYIQDQSRLMKKIFYSEKAKESFATGMEFDIANKSVDHAPKQKVSFADNYEGMLDYCDTLVRYLYYVKREDLKISDTNEHGDIHPFRLPAFQEITYIAQQRAMYEELEEKFRYSQWNIRQCQNTQGEDVSVFYPTDKKKYKQHLIAATRRKYHLSVRTIENTDTNSIENAMGYIDKLAEQIDIRNVENFKMDRAIYNNTKAIVHPIISSYKSLTKKYYFQCEFNKLKVEDLLWAYEFLLIFSQVYITAVQMHFDEKDYSNYKYLVPVLNFEYLVEMFSNLYSIQKDKAKKILKCFMYDEKVRNEDGDIYSKPLIKINQSQILFCESLIEQINIDRLIEIILQKYNVKLAPVGTEFENKLINSLKEISEIQVNTNHVVFTAYDEREVEFDFLGTLEDNLLLFEFKSVLTPYDDKEVYQREKVIKEGVEQIKRRSLIVQRDWEKIRSSVNIKLPEQPYRDEKIIKVVCTNIYDFTTLYIDGVMITDESTLLKYFTQPLVGLLSKDKDGIKVIDAESLWKEGKPTVKEFKRYLEEPVTVGNLANSFIEEIKTIPAYEGEIQVAFNDIVLKEDPYRKTIKSMFGKKKIYPNDTCPCGSGKKYKKCCGSNKKS